MYIVSIALFWRVFWRVSQYNSVLQTFVPSHPLSTEPLKQSRSTVVVDTTLFSDLKVHQHWRFPTANFNTSMVMSGRPVNGTTLIHGQLGRRRPPKQLTSSNMHILAPVTLLESAEGETKINGRTGYRCTQNSIIVLMIQSFDRFWRTFNRSYGIL